MSAEQPPIYVVIHIYKTAGKTLLRNFQRNFKKEQFLAMYAPQIGLDKAESSANPGWVESKVVEYLRVNYTANTQCLFGHMAFYGIHELDFLKGRTVRYIVFVREPLDRIISLYNFLRYNSKNAWHWEIVENNWSITEWFTHSKGLWLHNGQMRQLLLWQRKDVLERRHLNADDVSAAKAVLDRVWFVGSQENFRSDTEYLYRSLGFKKISLNEVVNASRGDAKPDPATTELIQVDNALDADLYRHALSLRVKRDERIPEPTGFKAYIASVRQKIANF